MKKKPKKKQTETKAVNLAEIVKKAVNTPRLKNTKKN